MTVCRHLQGLLCIVRTLVPWPRSCAEHSALARGCFLDVRPVPKGKKHDTQKPRLGFGAEKGTSSQLLRTITEFICIQTEFWQLWDSCLHGRGTLPSKQLLIEGVGLKKEVE